MLTILRLASVIGVVSIGMTFVIIGGGIDLSVGAIVGARLGLGDHPRHPDDGRGHPLDRHGVRRPRGRRGLRPGQRRADRLRQARPVHRDARHAGRPPADWPRSSPSGAPRSSASTGFMDFWSADVLGIPLLVIIFAAGRRGRLGPAQPHHLRPPHPRRRRQPRGGPAGRHQRQAAHRPALRARRALLRHRRADVPRPHHDRQLHPRHAATSSTPSPRSSSAARCSPAGAAPSSAPCSAC